MRAKISSVQTLGSVHQHDMVLKIEKNHEGRERR